MADLDQQVALVTGAGGGLGRGIAGRLAEKGARLVLADLDAGAIQKTAEALGSDEASVFGLKVDVSDRDSVKTCVQDAREHFGRIDILVNNAGWDRAGPFLEGDPADWRQIIDINLGGVLNFCYEVAPEMQERGSGRIINIGSDAARVGSSAEAVYSAAKGGIVSFSKSLARELAKSQVTVNAICPGPADTRLFYEVTEGSTKLRDALTRAIPMRRLGQPEDVAAAVAFFASPEAGYITGQTLSVSGGLTMA